jgi:hypothetical protein
MGGRTRKDWLQLEAKASGTGAWRPHVFWVTSHASVVGSGSLEPEAWTLERFRAHWQGLATLHRGWTVGGMASRKNLVASTWHHHAHQASPHGSSFAPCIKSRVLTASSSVIASFRLSTCVLRMQIVDDSRFKHSEEASVRSISPWIFSGHTERRLRLSPPSSEQEPSFTFRDKHVQRACTYQPAASQSHQETRHRPRFINSTAFLPLSPPTVQICPVWASF